MTGTIILASTLVPTNVTLSSQQGGTLNVASNVIVKEVAANAFGVLSNSGVGATTNDVSSSTGTVWSTGAVTLRNNAIVNGDVHGGSTVTLMTGASVTGTVTQNQTLGTTSVTISATFPASTNDQTITGSLTITPGGFRTFHVNGGGTLTFNGGGNYFFDSLSFDSGSNFVVVATGGPVFIYVRTAFAFSNANVSFTTGDATQLRVVLFGATGITLGNAFSGTIAAPNATLTIQTVATYTGAYLANSIVTGSGITFVHMAFTGWESPNLPLGSSFRPAAIVAKPAPAPAVPAKADKKSPSKTPPPGSPPARGPKRKRPKR